MFKTKANKPNTIEKKAISFSDKNSQKPLNDEDRRARAITFLMERKEIVNIESRLEVCLQEIDELLHIQNRILRDYFDLLRCYNEYADLSYQLNKFEDAQKGCDQFKALFKEIPIPFSLLNDPDFLTLIDSLVANNEKIQRAVSRATSAYLMHRMFASFYNAATIPPSPLSLSLPSSLLNTPHSSPSVLSSPSSPALFSSPPPSPLPQPSPLALSISATMKPFG